MPLCPVLTGRRDCRGLSGEWSRIDVYANKDVLELYVNGIRQNRTEGLAVRSGPIALQLEGRPVEFRALRLRRL